MKDYIFNAEPQHKKNKYHVLERIALLLDKDTFSPLRFETDFDGVITGEGKIFGTDVCFFAQDFTYKGGTVGENHGRNIASVIKRAVQENKIVIGIYDSGGARIEEGSSALDSCASFLAEYVRASGIVPQISIVLGPCAGASAYAPALSDFVFSVRHTGSLFVTGPNVVKTVTGETTDIFSLGGAEMHAESTGAVHVLSDTEKDCFIKVRDLVKLLSSRNRLSDFSHKNCKVLSDVVYMDRKQTYNMISVIEDIADNNNFFELQPLFAKNIITGFISFCGVTVGVVANQPLYDCGVLDIDSSDKSSRFVRFCDLFGIPILTFVDTPGYLPGTVQEHNGIITHGAKLIFAYAEATTLKVTVILRKAYGGAYIAMGSKGLGADKTYVFPSAEVAVMGAEGAVNILYGNELSALSDNEKEEFIKRKAHEYFNEHISVARGDGSFSGEIIYPDKLREKLYGDLVAFVGKTPVIKKHGNIPL